MSHAGGGGVFAPAHLGELTAGLGMLPSASGRRCGTCAGTARAHGQRCGWIRGLLRTVRCPGG